MNLCVILYFQKLFKKFTKITFLQTPANAKNKYCKKVFTNEHQLGIFKYNINVFIKFLVYISVKSATRIN